MANDSTVTRRLEGLRGELTDAVGIGMHYRFNLNKKEYRLRVPAEEETENRLIVYIEPIQEPDRPTTNQV